MSKPAFQFMNAHEIAQQPEEQPAQKPAKKIWAAYLRNDERIRKPVLAEKRVFQSPEYEVYLQVFPEIPGKPAFPHQIVTARVHYFENNIDAIVRLATYEPERNPMAQIQKVLTRLQETGVTPLHLVRDAKRWCRIPFTDLDLKTFEKAGQDFI